MLASGEQKTGSEVSWKFPYYLHHQQICVQAGKRAKKGMHSGKEAPLHRVNDVSLPGTGARAKQYLTFLQRGRVSGVVEFVITGHRLKASVNECKTPLNRAMWWACV